MDRRSFEESLAHPRPPAGLAPELEALWWLGKGDWDRAHRIVQRLESRAAARIHAHLHRIEGDLWNADYWYRRAGVPSRRDPLEAEREDLLRDLLGRGPS